MKLVIKEHPTPKQRLMQIAAVIGVILTCWGLYEYGRYSAGYDTASVMMERIERASKMSELESSISELREQKAVLERTSQIDHQAYGQLESELAGLRDEIVELNRELAFYRGIVTQEGGSGVMRMQRFQVTPTSVQRGYHFQLVLTQAFTSSGITTGVVTLTLEGLEGQIAKSLTLAQLTDNKLKELPFRFKYFQEIAGDVVLPAGFVPRRVIVEVEPRGGEKLQNSFDWPA